MLWLCSYAGTYCPISHMVLYVENLIFILITRGICELQSPRRHQLISELTVFKTVKDLGNYHFIGEAIEAQKDKVTCLRLLSIK